MLNTYLSYTSKLDFNLYTLQDGQPVAFIVKGGQTPLETYYYDKDSLLAPNGETVFKPDSIALSQPGRYIKSLTATSWEAIRNKPVIPTKTSDLENNSNFISTVPPQSWASITQKPVFATVATTGSYTDLSNKPTEITDNAQLANGAGYIKTVPPQTWNSITGKPAFSTVATSGSYNDLSDKPVAPTETDPTVPAYSKSLTAFSVIKASTDPLYKSANYAPTSGEITTALGITPINQAGARNAISLTTNGVSGVATYNPGTGVLNVPNYSGTIYTGTANVTSAGNSIYYLTSDGTPTGSALFTSVTFASPFVNDSTKNYTYGWNYNSSTKALTVNTKTSENIVVNALNITVLGAPANVPVGTTVSVLVRGN